MIDRQDIDRSSRLQCMIEEKKNMFVLSVNCVANESTLFQELHLYV